MRICKSLEQLAEFHGKVRAEGRTLGLIPTMGALHTGHLSLVKQAQADGHATLVTLFVNPTQFAAHEDLDTYPDTWAADVTALEELGVEGLFAPPVGLMYPDGESTRVRVEGISARWEGEDRPHFFEGVATVVAKLLIAAGADAAYFGEKDYQQLQVIQRLATDLLMSTKIIGCPTVREDSGLAMSSRNAYLTEDQRSQAAVIYRSLLRARDGILASEPISKALETARERFLAAGFSEVSYLSYVDAQTLEPQDQALPSGSGRLLFAGKLAGVRLIDNVAV